MEPEESGCEGRDHNDEQHERGTGHRRAPQAMVHRAHRHDPRRGRRLRGIQHRDADLPLDGVPLLLVATASSGSDINQGSAYTQAQMLSFARLATSSVVLDPVADELDAGLSTTQLRRR